MCEACSPSRITKKRGGREGRKEEERMRGTGKGRGRDKKDREKGGKEEEGREASYSH